MKPLDLLSMAFLNLWRRKLRAFLTVLGMVIGVADDKWGERPLALVLLKPDHVGQITEHALRNYAAHAIEAAGISRYGVLLQVRFVKTLVKTSVGKMNKRLMRADPDALCI